MRRRKILALLLCLAMVTGLLPMGALADEPVDEPVYVLMNIPYADFYKAEGVEGVDAVTSATKKAIDTPVKGSYHNSEASVNTNTNILGVTYPVFVADKTALDSNKKVTPTEQTAEDALFAAGDYAYVELSDKPASYKTLTIDASAYSFGAASARAVALENVTANVTALTRRGDYQIYLSGGNASALSSSTVYAVTLTTDDGGKYALRHLENIWEGIELAVCTGHTTTIKNGAVTPNSEMYKDLEGKTVNEIKYFVKDSEGAYKTYTIATELVIPTYPTASFTDAKNVAISNLSEDDANAVAVNAPETEDTSVTYYTAEVYTGSGVSKSVLATDVPINNGKLSLPNNAVSGTTYRKAQGIEASTIRQRGNAVINSIVKKQHCFQ